ncbi:hypothetical protein QBC46DRAFT_362544 [Diplogelasinospora grovesii]|uniref:Rhodopsin domain-containing protein n=1 Tax=Diplogelasinospora grovesii TaxID=303347 RepID=A0AAN6NCK0_9PEZI|nr:hypothetical protein QBC46DRAFT_362544 [Diplogelasinospora grovesii]
MSNPIPSAEYIGYRVEVFVGVFAALQIAAVALRFYARSLTSKASDLDDWLVFISLLGQMVAGGIAIGGVKQAAIGYHVSYVEQTNPEALTTFFKYLVAISAWYYVTVSISKVAICVLYRRLFPQRSVFIVLCITVGILVSTPLVGLIVDLAACRPFSANWASPEVQATQCIDKEALFVWSTFPNIVTDVVMLSLPLPIVWRLHASTHLKLALTFTFLIGSIGLVASIMRFLAFANNNSFVDATYAAVELVIWTIAEPRIYLISACLLMYRPLLERVSSKFKTGSLNRSKVSSTNPSGRSENHKHQGHGFGSGNASIALRSKISGGGKGGGFKQLPAADMQPEQQQPG